MGLPVRFTMFLLLFTRSAVSDYRPPSHALT